MRARVEVNAVVGAVTVGVICAGAMFFLLSGLARPQAFKSRIGAVEDEIARAERLAGSGGNPSAYAAGAVCSGSAQGADELKRRIETAAAQSSVALTALAVDPAPSDSAGGRIAPVRLQFEATGKYEAVVGLLGALARPAPQIFVDTIDLKPKDAGAASVKFAGEAWCWTAPV